MRLLSLDGLFVDIEVTGYQFGRGSSSSEGVDWDANWLMIRGKTWDGFRSWEFHDPCMTTWEARKLGSWLRGVADPHPATDAGADPEAVRLWLTEQNLMFTLAAASEGIVSLDVYFNAESRPPSGSNDDCEGLGHKVRLTIPQADILAGAAEWQQDLLSFPTR